MRLPINRVRSARAFGVASTLACAMLAVPSTAGAVSCERNAGLLSVEMGTSDLISLSVSSGNIVVSDLGTPVACAGSPTVTNVGAISVFNPPASTSGGVTILEAGDFVPGAALQDGSDSGGGTPEIEIFVNLNNASFSQVSVRDRGGNVRFGDSGINPNAGSEVAPDADIFANNVRTIEGWGATAGGITDPVVLGAQGGLGTGGPFPDAIELLGNRGNDQLTGGIGGDHLKGFHGNDTLLGGEGDDRLEPGLDADFADGGGGIDTLDYLFNSSIPSLAIDLAIAGPQNTGAAGMETIAGIENVDATGGPDILRGDDRPNDIFASSGNDVVEGRGGADTLKGWLGSDSIDARDGGADTVECGADTDDVVADAVGVDTLIDCENVTFAAATDPGGGGGDGGGGGSEGTGTGPAPLTFGPQTLVTLRLAAARVRRRGPLRVRVANANDFSVSARLSGRTVRKVEASAKRHLRLAAKSVSVAAKASRTVRLALPRALRRELVRKGSLALRINARLTDPVGNVRTLTKRVRPKLKRAL